MSGKGTIRLRDIASNDVLNFGLEYAKNLQIAIDKTEQLKAISAEFNKISDQFKGVKNSKDFIDVKKREIELSKQAAQAEKEKNRALLEAQRIQTEKLRADKLALDIEKKKQVSQGKAIDNKKKLIPLTAKERYEISQLNKKAKEAAIISSELSTEYEKQAVKLIQLRRRYKDAVLTQGYTSKETQRLRKEVLKLDSTLKKVDASVGQFQRNVGNYGKSMASAAMAARNMASALGYTGGLFLFVQTMQEANGIVRSFGKTMSNIAGIYRTNRDSLQSLEDKIISVAGSSVNTATEVANLAENLATLGKTQSEIETLLAPVNDLSIGLNAASDEAGEFLVQMLNTFGASSNEAGKYADVIATIRTSTSLDFQRMRDSFQYLAPISKALNKDIAYTGSLIGILSDNGIKAERAGRLLVTAQQKLASENKSLTYALGELNEAKKNNSSELDLLKLASELFGKQAAALGVILANNTDLIDKNAESIRNNSGALNDLVSEQLTSLDSHFRILASRWEEYILNTDKASGASNQLKSVLKFLSDNLSTIINTVLTAAKWFGIYKVTVFSVNLITKVATKANYLYRLSLLAVNGGIKKVITSLRTLKAVNSASVFGAIVFVLGTAYELFQQFSSGAREATDEMKQLNKEMEQFVRTGEKYTKVANAYKQGIDQINVSMDGQGKILDRVKGKLKEYADDTYQYNQEHIRIAKELIKNTHEKEISKIKEKINASASFSKKQINYLLQEIAAYQALEKVIKTNEDYLDKKEEERKKKAQESKKEDEKNRKQAAKDRLELQSIELKNVIETNKEIVDDENKTTAERLKANLQYYDKSIRLLELKAKDDIKNAQGRADKIKAIELQLEIDKENIIREGENNAQKILKDSFEKKKEEILKKKELNEKEINEQLEAEEKRFRDLLKKEVDNQKTREKLVKEHEERVQEIKRKAAENNLKNQIQILEKELEKEGYTAEQKEELNKILSEAKLELSKLSTEGIIADLDKQKVKEKAVQDYKVEQIKNASKVLADSLELNASNLERFLTQMVDGFGKGVEGVLNGVASVSSVVGDIMGSIYQGNIESINEEIRANDEYYANKIELAEGDRDEQDKLRKQQEVKREQLEKKKGKEQEKQAKLQKAAAIFQIGLNTAQAILGIWAQVPKFDFGVSAGLMTAFVGSLGLAQIAAVASKPIPKYAKGTNYHPGGLAEVAEERPEVIIEPNESPYIVSDRSVLDLPKGTKVVSSVDKYKKLEKASILTSLAIEDKKIKSFNERQKTFDDQLKKELIKETILSRKAFEKNKPNIIVEKSSPVDFNHEFFRLSNTDWDA
ncbi:Phage tail tape measure protein (Modular protein) [Tenacibaculum sp. 190524A05c]|uniref:phage tail tape measure protein n=1 Tax=Tenacibaculum platacis TaxID=3137852 RepID=UPI0031FB2F9F